MKVRLNLFLGIAMLLGMAAAAHADRVYYLVGMRHVYLCPAYPDPYVLQRQGVEEGYAEDVAAAHEDKGALYSAAVKRENAMQKLYDRCDDVRSLCSELQVPEDEPYQCVGVDTSRQLYVQDVTYFVPYPRYNRPCPNGWTWGERHSYKEWAAERRTRRLPVSDVPAKIAWHNDHHFWKKTAAKDDKIRPPTRLVVKPKSQAKPQPSTPVLAKPKPEAPAILPAQPPAKAAPPVEKPIPVVPESSKPEPAKPEPAKHAPVKPVTTSTPKPIPASGLGKGSGGSLQNHAPGKRNDKPEVHRPEKPVEPVKPPDTPKAAEPPKPVVQEKPKEPAKMSEPPKLRSDPGRTLGRPHESSPRPPQPKPQPKPPPPKHESGNGKKHHG